MINNAFLFVGINDAINVAPDASFKWRNTDSFSIEFLACLVLSPRTRTALPSAI